MVSNNTPLAGLLGIVVVIAIIGAISGLALSETDLLNFNTSAAEARIRELEAQLQAEKAASDQELYQAEIAAQIEQVASDLESHKAIESARVQAEKDKIRLEVTARQHKLDQDLALARLTRFAALIVMTLATLIVSVGLTVFLIQYGRSRLVLAQAEATHTQAAPWHVSTWRAEQIRRAREREVAEREAALGQQTTRKPGSGGNGRHRPKDKLIEGVT